MLYQYFFVCDNSIVDSRQLHEWKNLKKLFQFDENFYPTIVYWLIGDWLTEDLENRQCFILSSLCTTLFTYNRAFIIKIFSSFFLFHDILMISCLWEAKDKRCVCLLYLGENFWYVIDKIHTGFLYFQTSC